MYRLLPRGAFVTAALVVLIGVVLAAGGARLILLGGSWYYAIAGLGLIGVGVGLWLGRVWGLRLYWIILAGTCVWAFGEVGWNPWALAPRVAGPLVIGVWLASPWPRAAISGLAPVSSFAKRSLIWALSGACAAAVAIGAVVIASQEGAPAQAALVSPAPGTQWTQFGGAPGGARYAPIGQITRDNVAALTSAWTYHTGDWGGTFEATPLFTRDKVIFCTGYDIVVALDGDTGAEAWRYTPQIAPAKRMHVACRGVAYHEQTFAAAGAKQQGAHWCAARILLATIDARLIALDAETGAPCSDFGREGSVSLLEGIGPAPEGSYYVTSPPTIVGDNVVTGAFVLDNQGVNAPSGVIRSYDARTGALRWAWDMGRPARRGAPTGADIYTPATPNAWSVFSADPALGLVYVPLGNPAPDFWGGKRRPFDEQFGSAVVALDVKTGAPRWSFQTTHHDLWDYDAPSQPVLTDVPTKDGMRPALIQATKRGEIFVLDRRTGAPIFPVEERAVPQGAAPGDRLSPTQPFSALSVAPARLTESDMWGVSPIDQMFCRIWFKSLRYEGALTPPGVHPTLKFPGAAGAVNWGSVTIDEGRHVLIVNSSVVASVDRLIPREDAPPIARTIGPAGHYEWGPQVGTPFVARTQTFESRYLRIPCTAPPWGKLHAFDLATGQVKWSRPFGSARDSGPFGRASRLPLPMGVPNQGGSIATRSGLVFIGASVDRYLRAFDVDTGEELWRARLPAAAHATPMTYVSGRSGRQFVVVAAGGHMGMGPNISDAIMAFALPKEAVEGPAAAK